MIYSHIQLFGGHTYVLFSALGARDKVDYIR